jgi:hypothetical protein
MRQRRRGRAGSADGSGSEVDEVGAGILATGGRGAVEDEAAAID